MIEIIKVKQKVKKTITKNNLTVKQMLEKDNKSVLEFVDEIKNVTDRQRLLKELIGTLEITLLDRDAGKTGPKLIDQLKERLNNSNAVVKEYKLEDLIWWKGTEAQLEYLLVLLVNSKLIDLTQFNERFSLIAKHFKNVDGNRFKNKQVSQAVRNLRGANPPEAEKLEKIVTDTNSR